MQEWLPILLGPGGALVLMILVSRIGFKYFVTLLAKQEKRYEEQERRFAMLQISTLKRIHELSDAIENLTKEIERRQRPR